MSSEYERILEAENEKLREELGSLRTTLFDLAPRLDDLFDSIIKDANAIHNGYFERGQGCLQIIKKVKKEKDFIKKELSSK